MDAAAVREVPLFGLLSAGDAEKARAAGYVDAYPLSELQAGMVFHNLWERETATYHDIQAMILESRLEEAALRAAGQRLIEHHEVLRTTIHLSDYEEPLQAVHESVPVSLTVTDWIDRDAAEQRVLLQDFVRREGSSSFDLERGPLFELFAFRLTPTRFALLIGVHHAIVDGWTLNSLIEELLSDYARLAAGERLSAPRCVEVPLQRFHRAGARSVTAYGGSGLLDADDARHGRAHLVAPRPSDAGAGGGFGSNRGCGQRTGGTAGRGGGGLGAGSGRVGEECLVGGAFECHADTDGRA